MLSLETLFGGEADILAEREFQLLFVTNGFVVLGLAVLSPILDSLLGPFATTTASIGLLMSGFMAPSIVIIPLVGVLSDRYGRKPLIVIGLLVFGTAGTAIAFTTEFIVALSLRFIQGIGFAMVLPTIITCLGDIYAGEKESTAQGFRLAGSGVFQTIFPIVSGVLVIVAWQFPFFLFTLALPVAALIYASFQEPISTKAPPANRQGTGTDPAPSQSRLRSFLAHRRVQVALVAYGLYVIVWIGFLTYNSIIVVQLMGGTPAQAGVLAAVGSVAYAGAATQAGRITARFESRYIPLIFANVGLGVGFIIVVLSPLIAVAFVGIIITGTGMGVLGSLYRSVITGLAPEHLRGSLVSLAEAFLRLLATITPIGMGAIIAYATPLVGPELALQSAGVLASLLSAVGGIVCLVVMKKSPPVSHPY